ncbi:hypothetical protein [Roseivirga thermotolerans]|uniref:hypothetical protein n=1 Tax=Roseivirga thermotolerans TaxID=1758176 RepID=UPI00273DCB35|nr:hypothetical protein [Roseivirga thermotolerans]
MAKKNYKGIRPDLLPDYFKSEPEGRAMPLAPIPNVMKLKSNSSSNSTKKDKSKK